LSITSNHAVISLNNQNVKLEKEIGRRGEQKDPLPVWVLPRQGAQQRSVARCANANAGHGNVPGKTREPFGSSGSVPRSKTSKISKIDYLDMSVTVLNSSSSAEIEICKKCVWLNAVRCKRRQKSLCSLSGQHERNPARSFCQYNDSMQAQERTLPFPLHATRVWF
jgi:hypothetical protein